MVATGPFRPMMSAPTNAPIEVLHGRPEAVALAVWDEELQAWIRAGDAARRPLRWVTAWRLAK